MKAKIVELEDAIKQRDNEVSSDKTMSPVIVLLLLYSLVRVVHIYHVPSKRHLICRLQN